MIINKNGIMETKNLVQVQPDLLPLKTFEEKFAGALTGIKLSKIRYEDAKEVLRLVMLKIGLRAANIPVEEDKAILISHIAVNYGNHTLDEIILDRKSTRLNSSHANI